MALLYPSIVWDPALLAEPQLMGEASPARITDFRQLQPSRPLDYREAVEFIACNAATLSVYTIDLHELKLVLVQLPSGVELRSAPFMYQTQRRHATAMLTLTHDVAARVLEQLQQLAPQHSIPQPDANNSPASQPRCTTTQQPPSGSSEPLLERTPDQPYRSTSGLLAQAQIVHIHSTGRCGSTLLQKALGLHPQVQSLSEPDAFWCLATLVAQMQDSNEDASVGRNTSGMEFQDQDQHQGQGQDQEAHAVAQALSRGAQLPPAPSHGTHVSRATLLAMARTLTLLQAWLCLSQQPSRTTIVFKHRSNAVFAARLLAEAVPSSRAVWMCRALPGFAESWCSLVAGGRWWMYQLMRWTPLGTFTARRLSTLQLMSDGSMGRMAQRLRESEGYGGQRDVMWLWSLAWLCHCEEALNLQLNHSLPKGRISRTRSSSGGTGEGLTGSTLGGDPPSDSCTGTADGQQEQGDRVDRATRPSRGFFASVVSYERLLSEQGAAATKVLLDLGLPLPPQGSGEAREMERAMAKVFASNSQAGTVMSSRRAASGLSSVKVQASWFGPRELQELQRLVDFDVARRGCDFALGLKGMAGAGSRCAAGAQSDAEPSVRVGGGERRAADGPAGPGACVHSQVGSDGSCGAEAGTAAGRGGALGRGSSPGDTPSLNGSAAGAAGTAVIRSIWHTLDPDHTPPHVARHGTGGLWSAGWLAAAGVAACATVVAASLLVQRHR